MSGMMLKAGSIALIPFPFTDLSSQKKRPILLLTEPDSYGDFIVLPITSKGHHPDSIELIQKNMLEGTLPRTSWIRTDKVFTLSQTLVVKVIGIVKANLLEQAINGLITKLKKQSTLSSEL